MASHAHLAADDPALIDAAAAAMDAGGVAWTSLRADVFAVLAAGAQPMSAYDVTERVSARVGRRVQANSVYRILDLFVVNNLAKRVESRNAYVVNTHPACVHDCIFLVCEGCGDTRHLDDDRLAGALRARASAAGFLPLRPVLEVQGRCERCGDSATEKDNDDKRATF
ncbi:Fur family transcriptional regulator [Sandaracinobacteroides saxicola]|uniref:Transcriptional repressor n=1 Tax=Sandaracinobacteroides saxicola TaxID=2759707 RepID=A0A7G5IEW4_9SPHN|nr:transcriptional repressor [Sandaracinobacteroides saxicola]QMW21906.1 transcriptional repressor [Sandaracinobacteroides saxicola]